MAALTTFANCLNSSESLNWLSATLPMLGLPTKPMSILVFSWSLLNSMLHNAWLALSRVL